MGHERKLKSCCKLLQNGEKCTGRRQLRTRTRVWRSGRGAGSYVGTIAVGYACSDCAIWVVAAPLLVSRGGSHPRGVKMDRLDRLEKWDTVESLTSTHYTIVYHVIIYESLKTGLFMSNKYSHKERF